MSSKIETIYGTHAVLSAWQNPKRICHKLYVTEKTLKQINAVPAITKRPKPTLKDPNFFKSYFKEAIVHQNMILECDALHHPSLKSYLKNDQLKDLIVILDQIQDPQNLGAIIRTAVAFNVGAIILQDQNSVGLTASAIKVATGSYEHIPIIQVSNLNQTVKLLKKNNYWIAAFAENGTHFLHEYKPANKNAIILGAEGSGIRDLLLKNSDIILKLQTSNKQSSLNVSNAAAIAIYEFSKNI